MSAYPGRLALLRARPARFQLASAASGLTQSSPAATLSSSGGAQRAVSRPMSASLPPSGALGKIAARAAAATLSFAGAFARGPYMSATLSFVGSMRRFTSYVMASVLGLDVDWRAGKLISFAATLSFVGADLSRFVRHGLASALQPLGALPKRLQRALPGSLVILGPGALSRAATRSLAASLATSGAFGRFAYGKALGAALALPGALSRTTYRAQTAALAASGVISRSTSRALAAAAATAGALSRATSRSMAAAAAAAGALSRSPARSLSATLGLSGAWAQVRPTFHAVLLQAQLALSGVAVLERVARIAWELAARPVRWLTAARTTVWKAVNRDG